VSDDIASGSAGLGKSYAWRPAVAGPGNRLECASSAPLSYSQTLAELVAAMLERFPEQRRACMRTPGSLRYER